jgi:hypothetical protein
MLRKIVNKHILICLFLVGIGLTARLYKISEPLGDWHSWRQTDTASVTREFVKHDYSIWQPHFQDLSNIPNGLNNNDGYRMVEFPLVNYGVAQLLKAYPHLDLVTTSRAVSVAFSLLSIISLYGIVYLLSKRSSVAFLSGLIFAILPYSVFYSRVVLPEPAMISMQLLSLWLFIAWLERKHFAQIGSIALYTGSLVAFALALLLKPTAIFIAPVFAAAAFGYLGVKALINPWLWAYALSFAPLIAWRKWIQQYPSGIPASNWLLNGNGIRLRPAWWRWLFADRLARLILGYWGTVLLVMGIVGNVKSATKKHLFNLVTLTWAASMLAYLVVFATGNVQHDYYQTLLIPIVSVLCARGIVWLLDQTETAYKIVAYPTLLLVIALSIFFGWWEVRGYYNINNWAMVRAGQRVDQLTPTDAKVIAPYGGDTAFLFQTNRTGWPIGGEIDKFMGFGARYYVSTAYDDEAKKLSEKYTVLEKTDEYIIIELTPKKL